MRLFLFQRFTFIEIHWAITCTCTECNQPLTLLFIQAACLCVVCKTRQRMQSRFSMKITIWPVANELWEGSKLRTCKLCCYLSEEKNVDLLGARIKKMTVLSPARAFNIFWPLVEFIIILRRVSSSKYIEPLWTIRVRYQNKLWLCASAICLLLANDDCVRGLVLMQLSHLERSDGCIAKAIAVRQHRPFSQVIHRRSTAFCHLLGNLLIRLFYIMHFHDENFHLSSQHTKIYSNHSLFSFYASLNCSK